VGNFRFVPQIVEGAILLHMSQIAPKNGRCAQDAAGIGVADQCRHLLTCLYALPCALDWLLQPVLLDSASSSCCCTFSSNFCVTMAEQLCSNPWQNIFVEGKIWDHPSKMSQKSPNLGGGVVLWYKYTLPSKLFVSL